jgi:aspartyl-tRNA(Asn)/glutamyl-tRNA(Gln) amidotransferase subunit A
MPDFHRWTIDEACAALRRREVSSTELTRALLSRIEGTESQVQAFITVSADAALAQAVAADARLRRGDESALCGVPLGIKDVILTEGIRTTAGSKILENFVPPYNATVTQKLLDAGAVCLGKLNCDEFAMGSSTENSAFAPTRTSRASRAGRQADRPLQ